MGPVILFCRDPLSPRRTDPHFAAEARAAGEQGLRVARIDHDALLAGDTAGAVAGVPRDAGTAWYRGWMVPAGRYAELAGVLAGRGVTLLTPAGDYRRAHELPGWYGAFADVTPRSVWFPAEPGQVPGAARLAAGAARLGVGPAVVKDYVKSRKHEWDEACYVPDLADTDRLAAVAGRFVELQGAFLAGGVVLRSFERFTAAGEARVWWVDGRPVLVTAHPDTPDRLPAPVLDAVAPCVAALGCRFVTTDMALREDGVWRVVEVGDGQVSGLPRSADPAALLGGSPGPELRPPDRRCRCSATAGPAVLGRGQRVRRKPPLPLPRLHLVPLADPVLDPAEHLLHPVPEARERQRRPGRAVAPGAPAVDDDRPGRVEEFRGRPGDPGRGQVDGARYVPLVPAGRRPRVDDREVGGPGGQRGVDVGDVRVEGEAGGEVGGGIGGFGRRGGEDGGRSRCHDHESTAPKSLCEPVIHGGHAALPVNRRYEHPTAALSPERPAGRSEGRPQA